MPGTGEADSFAFERTNIGSNLKKRLRGPRRRAAEPPQTRDGHRRAASEDKATLLQLPGPQPHSRKDSCAHTVSHQRLNTSPSVHPQLTATERQEFDFFKTQWHTMQKKLNQCLRKVDTLEKKVERMREASLSNIKQEPDLEKKEPGVKMVLKLKNRYFFKPQKKHQGPAEQDSRLEHRKFVQRSFKKQARSLQTTLPCRRAQQLDTEPMEARTPATILKNSHRFAEQRNSSITIDKLNCQLQLNIDKSCRPAWAARHPGSSSKHSLCEDRLTCKESPAQSAANRITM